MEHYNQWELSVPADSMLVLYSDGIVENPDASGEIIGRADAATYF
ncbi:MAG: serine/threonine-protein phosphatase [Alphaproteobacteria bacterium]|nr:serine/threonine-protein phosphatase [Rhodospirillales bacterium]MCW9045707.1 serine/threonine-protein phosphatase [Alphaproteobacteria bacterium]